MSIFDEKSNIWVESLKLLALVQGAISITLAVIFLLKAVSNSGYYSNSESYLIFGIAIILFGVVAYVINMVLANALYNLQEMRKAVAKEEESK